ncbi:unnamed protein product [Polarella glacialis]|uniref:Uncharacterized protein n=1 Tax=Polarella glacialis TaxID=89957 RepID=A0A813F3W7_POLGL|nr:unnamed protein product [Polarella glacialis]
MTKLSIVLKQDEVLGKLCRLSLAAWLKLRRTSRLFMWRLDDTKLLALQLQLVDELSLVFVDMHEVCIRGDAECVWIFLSQGMSVKMRDAEGATLTQKASHSAKTPILKLLVEKGGNLNAKGSYGYTPLHEACYIVHPDVCSHLLQKGRRGCPEQEWLHSSFGCGACGPHDRLRGTASIHRRCRRWRR